MSSNSAPRIFVVDDEYVIASTLAVILNKSGFSARCFTRPLEALTAARSDIPDLLISDVAMPGLSGIDLGTQMRAQHPECQILLFSGHAATLGLLEDARNQGFHLLPKSAHPSEFLAEMAMLRSRKVPIETAKTMTAGATNETRTRRFAGFCR